MFKRYEKQLNYSARACSRIFGLGSDFFIESDLEEGREKLYIDKLCTVANFSAKDFLGSSAFKIEGDCLKEMPPGYIDVRHFLTMNKGAPAQALIDAICSGEIIVESALVEGADYYTTYYVCDRKLLIQKVKEYNDSKKKEASEIERIDFLNREGESSLRDEIASDLSEKGFDVEIEKKIFTGQRMDVYAIKRGATITVECKKDSQSDDISKAIGQLACYKFEHRSAIKVAAFINMPSDDYRRILTDNNIQIVNRAEEIIY